MLYFIPQTKHNVNAVDIDELGLRYAFEEPAITKVPTVKGLGDHEQGVLLAEDGAYTPDRIVTNESRQTWQECGKFWVGYWNDMKPTPDSLVKSVTLTGDELKLGGDTWLIPKAISFDEVDGELIRHVRLSRYVTMLPDGTLSYGEVEDRFRSLFEVAYEWLEGYVSPAGVSSMRLFQMAGESISYNYRVNLPEITLLNLLTDESAEAIMNIVCDYDAWVNIVKKKALITGTSSDGEQEGSPVTCPA